VTSERKAARGPVAYVSDEYFTALADALVDLAGPTGTVTARSSASGAVWAELAPGEYRVVVAKQGYGAKRSNLLIREDVPPAHLRLLSDTPYGYLWPKHVRVGERSELRVHGPEPYELNLWRYGLNRECIERIGQFPCLHPVGGQRQTVPDGDLARSGVAWVPEPLGPRQTIEAPARSGLYYVHMKTSSGRFAAFPWIVAPRSPSAEVAVLGANITWNAYNNFGGRSNYVAGDRLPDQPIINPHQDLHWYRADGVGKWVEDAYEPISFDRPEPWNAPGEHDEIDAPLEPVGIEHTAPADWRLLGWLEREGVSYDYYADSQLADGTLDLAEYRVLVLGAHAEYWTRGMYERVSRWVTEEGGRLMYLGGNGIDCEVELRGDTMVVFNEDSRRWATRAETRFEAHGAPSAPLLGVVTTMAGMGTGAPYRLLVDGHWIFETTQLQAGDLFGTRSLDHRCPGGASGHETDKVSRHAPPGLVHLARGENVDEGGADMVYVEHPSGGRVFSAGSISYVATLLVDHHISTLTANVLRRFLA